MGLTLRQGHLCTLGYVRVLGGLTPVSSRQTSVGNQVRSDKYGSAGPPAETWQSVHVGKALEAPCG